MCVMVAERRQRVVVVEAQVTVAVGIRERDDALAAEGAVGIEQIGETFVGKMRLYGILHRLLASRQSQKKQSEEVFCFHCYRLRR